MAGIQDLKGLLETKLDAVTVDVTLLRADLKKVMEKVTTTEMDITRLQLASKRLESQVQFLTKDYERIIMRLEDQEGRSQRNKGHSVKPFLETLITMPLRPKRLSTFFTIERAQRVPVPPRTTIARVFNIQDRDTILQTARYRGDLQ
ncbi:hypothetical protein NDU88_004527 [Pleurodeles waltl]|uniref:Uncharacterized protein n=1 Tax=Pleurodeles waltl TaxID=8319 RepID=A0AAV7V380_PLEWA|nr:hypothetical protein NDU88_004527 [Pleurodeles waltl]